MVAAVYGACLCTCTGNYVRHCIELLWKSYLNCILIEVYLSACSSMPSECMSRVEVQLTSEYISSWRGEYTNDIVCTPCKSSVYAHGWGRIQIITKRASPVREGTRRCTRISIRMAPENQHHDRLFNNDIIKAITTCLTFASALIIFFSFHWIVPIVLSLLLFIAADRASLVLLLLLIIVLLDTLFYARCSHCSKWTLL